ncbi:hypothetical protein OC844_006867 [Tilletia horrida]|nr:hypothetical protein OC844_006867 [Tilletia horrida]
MSFAALPGEIHLLVAKYALLPADPYNETYKSYRDRETQLRLVSPKLNLATKMISRQDVHMLRLSTE